MKRNYMRLVAIAVIVLCAGQSFPAKKQSKLTELEKISNNFKVLADRIVLKRQDLLSIKDLWAENSTRLDSEIGAVKAGMSKTDSKSLGLNDADSIVNAKNQFEKLWKIVFVDSSDIAIVVQGTVDKNFIESVRTAIAIKPGLTGFGGDAPGIRQIKTALRNALLQLKRIVEYISKSNLAELKKTSLEFKTLADNVVLKGKELGSISKAWETNLRRLCAEIEVVKDGMPQEGKDSLSPSNAGRIANAEKQFKGLWKIVFVDRNLDIERQKETVDKNFIESVRTAIAIKPGPTEFGGDAPGTRQIKTALRNALLQLKRIVEHLQDKKTGKGKKVTPPEDYEVEVELD